MTSPQLTAETWLRQAENDLMFSRSVFEDEYWAQCCFICQQCAEKAIKSVCLKRGLQFPLSHSITEICKSLKINGKLLQAAAVLDQYYVTGRYPAGGSTIAPFEMFQKSQAQQAIEFSLRFFKFARIEMKKKKARSR